MPHRDPAQRGVSGTQTTPIGGRHRRVGLAASQVLRLTDHPAMWRIVGHTDARSGIEVC